MILARSWLGQIGWNVFISTIPRYTWMHFHFREPIRIPVTLSEHCTSHSARFKNCNDRAKETWKDPQTSKGVDALKQPFLRKKDTVPRCCPRFQKCVLVKSPLMTRVDRRLVNSTAPRGQHLVKCVLNPRIVHV